MRLETKGRGGKTVTVIDGFAQGDPGVKALAQELKRACGTGGTIAENAIELQGDRRDQVRALLQAKGLIVKG